MATSPLMQLRTLERQKLRLLEDVKAELLQKIDNDLKLLRGLGFDYAISTRSPKTTEGKAKARANGKAKARANGKAKTANGRHSPRPPCSVCGFATKKPHDARSHRWQKPKAPFTGKELEERGMIKM